jgi:hypothetical protein
VGQQYRTAASVMAPRAVLARSTGPARIRPAAVSLRNTAVRLLPGSSFVRSLGPVLDWTA